jgi:hypothetical protein
VGLGDGIERVPRRPRSPTLAPLFLFRLLRPPHHPLTPSSFISLPHPQSLRAKIADIYAETMRNLPSLADSDDESTTSADTAEPLLLGLGLDDVSTRSLLPFFLSHSNPSYF